MARLLIVSRSMALAMRLADQHEVNEHPVDDLETLGTELDADVLVLDVGDPMLAVTTVNGLREAGQITPVLLVSGYQPEWEQVEAQQVDGVVVVPLPITRQALLSGIAELTGSPEPDLDVEPLADSASSSVTDQTEQPVDDAELSAEQAPDVSDAPAASGTPGKLPGKAADRPNGQQAGTSSENVQPGASAVGAQRAGSNGATQPAQTDANGREPAPAETGSSTTGPGEPGQPNSNGSVSAGADQSAKPGTREDSNGSAGTGQPAANGSGSVEGAQPVSAGNTNGATPEPSSNGSGSIGTAQPSSPVNGTTADQPSNGNGVAQQPGSSGSAGPGEPARSGANDTQAGSNGSAGTDEADVDGLVAASAQTRPVAQDQNDRDQNDQDQQADEPGDSDQGDEPGSPPWGSPVTPGSGVPDFNDPARFSSPAPPSPPWGETVRVGASSPNGQPVRWPGQPAGQPTGQPAQPSQPVQPPAQPGPYEQQPAAQYQQPAYPAPETGSPSPLGPPSRRLPRLGNRPRKLQRRPHAPDTQGLGLVTDPLGPRTDPYGFSSSQQAPPAPNAPVAPGAGLAPGGASALDRRLDSEAAALAGDRPGRVRSASGIVMRPADLVQSLLDQVGDLYGVSDTAQVLADDVIERADADAAAILVPDGPIWRVSGGVGLRPLERRLVLESTHWLISEIGSAGRAVLIDDTDIIRPQLAGAPLAAWRHLLAVPVPDVRAIVVLARGKEAGPFTDRDLAAVIAPVREAAALLAQAVQTRRLARALSSLRESETDTSTQRRPNS